MLTTTETKPTLVSKITSYAILMAMILGTVLNLCGITAISWWIITIPLWIPLAIFTAICGIMLFIFICWSFFGIIYLFIVSLIKILQTINKTEELGKQYEKKVEEHQKEQESKE